jgi:hypothetical protein
MKQHLSPEQVSGILAGVSSPGEEQHASECDQCNRELTRFRETLSCFRGSVTQWADRQRGSSLPDIVFLENRSFAVRVRRLRWVLATATMVLVLALPLYKYKSDRERDAQAAQDSLLLEQVNQHISRTVPAPMEPLMELLSDVYIEEPEVVSERIP